MLNASTNAIFRNEILKAAKIKSRPRLIRLLQNPYLTLKPMLMRRMGTQKKVDIKTIWGGQFSGVLPEAVTSAIWRFKYFDTDVSLTLAKFLKEGGTFIDVGAHFGYFSLFASKVVGETGQVLSVEAMPSTFAMLRENIEKNASFKNVKLHSGAAFDKETTLTFNDFGLIASSLNSAFASRGEDKLNVKSCEKVDVQAQTLDALVEFYGLKSVNVVKIDAESSESFVLKGMTKTISKFRPIIITEAGDIDHDSILPTSLQIEILNAQNYTAHKWKENTTLEVFKPVGKVAYTNIVFIPNELMNDI